MNLQHLRYLTAFAEHRTLTDAAESLGISQPAISRALHELQEELRCALFQRVGRRLELTPAGHDVLKAARRALAAVDDISRISDSHAGANVLRIATMGALAAGMSDVLEQFIRRQPETRVQVLHVSTHAGMFDMLRRQDVDLGYGSIVRTPRGMAFTPARPIEIVLASPLGTQLPETVTIASLDRLPMLAPSPSEERRRLLDEPVERAGGVLNVVLESGDSTTFVSGIQAGIGSAAMWDVNAAQATGIEVRRFEPPRQIVAGFFHPAKPTSNVRTMLAIAHRLERKRQGGA